VVAGLIISNLTWNTLTESFVTCLSLLTNAGLVPGNRHKSAPSNSLPSDYSQIHSYLVQS